MSGTPGINPSTEISEGIISAQTKLSAPGGEVQARGKDDGTQIVEMLFSSGAIYENQITLADDNPTRFETTKLLHDVVIQVETYDALFGTVTNQRFSRGAGTTFGFTKVDISTLYFKNKTAGQNTKVTIIGTEV